MRRETLEKRFPVSGASSEEIYNREPPKDKGIDAWEAFFTPSTEGESVLNDFVQNQLVLGTINDLPSEGEIELIVNCLRTSESPNINIIIDLLKSNVALAKNPSLYRTSFVLFLNRWFSKAKELAKGKDTEAFNGLANRWHEETDYLSSPSRITGNDTYLKIISMGNSVIPLILKDLQERGGDWYRALRILSDYDPVPPEARGDVQRMKEYWLQWGREMGYIP